MNTDLDDFYTKKAYWQTELQTLRKIILKSELTETFKWRNPCYVLNDNNIFIVSRFKAYCALSFFKGVLLKDYANLLVEPGANSQAVRLLTFKSEAEIIQREEVILNYIQEAINLELSGAKVKFKPIQDYPIPVEFEEYLDRDERLNSAFKALTPGRQKGYLLYFDKAKQTQTKISRIEKYIPRILSGKGINDCICGKSKRLPACDGSHREL